MRTFQILISAVIGLAVGTGIIGPTARAFGNPTDDVRDRSGVISARDNPAERRGLLTVTVSGAVAGTGRLMIALHDGESGFPGHGKYFGARVVPVTAATSEIVFEDVPYGRYAVAIIYDKNANGRLDMRFGILPKEPIGFSNNAKVRFGPPKFDDAAFGVDQPHKRINVALR